MMHFSHAVRLLLRREVAFEDLNDGTNARPNDFACSFSADTLELYKRPTTTHFAVFV
jgi:hypothetical protein